MGDRGNKGNISKGFIIAGAYILGILLVVLYVSITWTSVLAFGINILSFGLFLFLGYGLKRESFKTPALIFLLISSIFSALFFSMGPIFFEDVLYLSHGAASAVALSFIFIIIAANVASHFAMYTAREDKGIRRVSIYLTTHFTIFFSIMLILTQLLSESRFYYYQGNVLSIGFALMCAVQVLVSRTRLNRNFSDGKVNNKLRGASLVVNVLLLLAGIIMVSLPFGSTLAIMVISVAVISWVNYSWIFERFEFLAVILSMIKYYFLASAVFRARGYSMKYLWPLAIFIIIYNILVYFWKKGRINFGGASKSGTKGFNILSLPSRIKERFSRQSYDETIRGVIRPGFGPSGRGDLPNYQLTSQQRRITPRMPSPPTVFGSQAKRKSNNLEKEL